MNFLLPGFDTTGEDPVDRIAGRIRESLRIPSAHPAPGP